MAFTEEDLKSFLSDLSPEDLSMLSKSLGVEDKKDDTPPPPTAPVIDENRLADRVASKITPPPPPPPAPAREAFDMKKFQEQFLADPLSGLDYAYQAKLGFSPSQALPILAQTLAQTRSQLEQLQAQTFRSQHQVSDEDWNKVDQFRQSKGLSDWQDAYDLAKARGIVGAGETTPPVAPVAPPRLPRGGAKDATVDDASFLANINGLSDEQIDALAMRAGIVTKSHLS